MDIEKEIKSMVRSAVMEEISNLGIKAVVREYIENAGFTHEDVRKIISEMADSYFRSAMNGGVEDGVRRILNNKVEQRIDAIVDGATREYNGWSGRDKLKKLIEEQIRREIATTYDFDVALSVTRCETGGVR